MLGLPHQHVHLEITKHEEDSLPVPHPEQLLVIMVVTHFVPIVEEEQLETIKSCFCSKSPFLSTGKVIKALFFIFKTNKI